MFGEYLSRNILFCYFASEWKKMVKILVKQKSCFLCRLDSVSCVANVSPYTENTEEVVVVGQGRDYYRFC